MIVKDILRRMLERSSVEYIFFMYYNALIA